MRLHNKAMAADERHRLGLPLALHVKAMVRSRTVPAGSGHNLGDGADEPVCKLGEGLGFLDIGCHGAQTDWRGSWRINDCLQPEGSPPDMFAVGDMHAIWRRPQLIRGPRPACSPCSRACLSRTTYAGAAWPPSWCLHADPAPAAMPSCQFAVALWPACVTQLHVAASCQPGQRRMHMRVLSVPHRHFQGLLSTRARLADL